MKAAIDDGRPAAPTTGQRARKVGGSYQATGRIVATFNADDGSGRVVFRFDEPAGLLHIFRDDQVEAIADE